MKSEIIEEKKPIFHGIDWGKSHLFELRTGGMIILSSGEHVGSYFSGIVVNPGDAYHIGEYSET